MVFADAFLDHMHSMAHKLGAYHHIPHGIAYVLMMEQVIFFNSAEFLIKMESFPQYNQPRFWLIMARSQMSHQSICCREDLIYKVFYETFSKVDILNEAGVEETGFKIPRSDGCNSH